MRKLLLSIMMFAAFGLWINAQTIENFESIKMNAFDVGTNGAVSVVANPDTAGNPSLYVGKMVRGFDGQPWAGWYATLPTPVDVTANRYVHLKLWKPRVSPIVFKFEGDVNSGDINPMTPQATTGMWEEFVFDMSVVSGPYVKIVLIPDFEDPLTLTEDIVLYFDDLYVNDDPTVGSEPVQVMENFETIPLNYMLGGEDDMSYMELIPNPDPTGVNLSPYVIHFHRDMNGVPWGGFWSNLPTAIDVTDNKYVHVKVWKPRISPIKFKIEEAGVGNEISSMNEQTLTNEWEDMVFDFSEYTGEWSIIAFLPDFEDPMTLTEDIDIYFDDILLNNDPNPIPAPAQTINVDMTGSGLLEGDSVWLAGALGLNYGTWNEPGTNMNNLMLDPEGDSIYSITLSLPDGVVAFKFFKSAGWGNGDPAPGGDRNLELTNQMNVFYKWGVDGEITPPETPTIAWTVDMSYRISMGTFDEAVDYVDVAGSFNDWNGENHHLSAIGNGKWGITVPDFTVGEDIAYKFRINGSWADSLSEFPAGGPDRTYTVLDGLNEIDVYFNNEVIGIYEYETFDHNIYPNPVNETLNIDNLIDVNKVEIYDITGQLVKSFINTDAAEQTQINTNDLKTGMYIITVFSKNSSASTKLMKY